MKASVRWVSDLWIGILKPAKAQNWMAGMIFFSSRSTQVEVGKLGAGLPRYPDIEIRVCEKGTERGSGKGETTDSKFLVHKALLTPRVSRYPISFSRPGCGSCSVIAVDSISRIAPMASG